MDDGSKPLGLEVHDAVDGSSIEPLPDHMQLAYFTHVYTALEQ